MMADKKTFLMYKSWNPMLENLTYEKLGELMYYILLYQDGVDNVKPTDPMLVAIFAMIKSTMLQDAEKYAEICAKRAESGKQGGRPKKHEEEVEKEGIQMKANAILEKQNKVKKPDTESDTDTENDNVTDIDFSIKKKRKEKKKELLVNYGSMLEGSNLPSVVVDKVMEWVKYKQERKEAYKEIGFRAFITQTERYVRNYGVDNVVDVINKTMASGYKGVVWDWLNNSKYKLPGKVDWEKI